VCERREVTGGLDGLDRDRGARQAPQVAEAAALDRPPGADDRQPVAQRLDLGQDVAREQVRPARRSASIQQRAMIEGVELNGGDRPAARRLDETREFFAVMQAELPALLRRWEERRSSR
jgi:hypothetical protein